MRDRVIQGDSNKDAERRSGPNRLTIAPHWRALLASNGWDTLDHLFALSHDASLTKPGLPHWRERLRATLTERSGRKIAVYVKRFRNVPLAQQFRRCWAGPPTRGTAWTEWTWLHQLAQADIAAPAPIAYGDDMIGWWERRSAVVMGAVAGVSLERWCSEHQGALPAGAPEALADLAARFHNLGVAHRDLYLAHVFGEALDTGAPRLSIIDLQRVVRLGRRRRRWIVKDLAALNYSTPPTAAAPRARLRWLKRYLRLCTADDLRLPSRLSRRDRVLVRRIVGKTEQIRRHDRSTKRSD